MSAFALDSDFDPAPHRERLTAASRVSAPGALSPETALAVAEALETERRWTRMVTTGRGAFSVPLLDDAPETPAQAAWLDEAVIDPLHGPMQYVFDARPLSAAKAHGLARGDRLDDFEAWLNGPEVISLARDLTGDGRITACDAQATRFLPGHVLTAHNDRDLKGRRLYAFVFNFSRDWKPDWGGLLLFHDAGGHVSEGFTPGFNTLNLFKAPQPHAVSQVADYAAHPRLAVSGWFLGPE